jgi:hypothetical protein
VHPVVHDAFTPRGQEKQPGGCHGEGSHLISWTRAIGKEVAWCSLGPSRSLGGGEQVHWPLPGRREHPELQTH